MSTETTATDETLLLLNEAISLGRRDGMAGQHLDAMCSARDEIERLRIQCLRYEGHIQLLEGRIAEAKQALGVVGGTI